MAQALSLPVPSAIDPQVVAFLTGNRHWYQSLFCAYTFVRNSWRFPSFRFYDDGTLQGWQKDVLTTNIPGSIIIEIQEVEERLDNCLPRCRYPALYRERGRFILMRKIMDVFAGQPDLVIFLDSDLLFWKEPTLLWRLAGGQTPFYMQDAKNCYSDSLDNLTGFFGFRPKTCVNTGILGMPGGLLDYDKAEHYCRVLADRATGIRHFFEQTLWALLLTDLKTIALPAIDYRVPDDWIASVIRRSPEHPTCVHYCGRTRLDYHRSEWKRCLHTLLPQTTANLSQEENSPLLKQEGGDPGELQAGSRSL